MAELKIVFLHLYQINKPSRLSSKKTLCFDMYSAKLTKKQLTRLKAVLNGNINFNLNYDKSGYNDKIAVFKLPDTPDITKYNINSNANVKSIIDCIIYGPQIYANNRYNLSELYKYTDAITYTYFSDNAIPDRSNSRSAGYDDRTSDHAISNARSRYDPGSAASDAARTFAGSDAARSNASSRYDARTSAGSDAARTSAASAGSANDTDSAKLSEGVSSIQDNTPASYRSVTEIDNNIPASYRSVTEIDNNIPAGYRSVTEINLNKEYYIQKPTNHNEFILIKISSISKNRFDYMFDPTNFTLFDATIYNEKPDGERTTVIIDADGGATTALGLNQNVRSKVFYAWISQKNIILLQKIQDGGSRKRKHNRRKNTKKILKK